MTNDQKQEELKALRDGFEWRGRLIINLRDELAKVADLNEQLADMLEAVCEENAHLYRKLVDAETELSNSQKSLTSVEKKLNGYIAQMKSGYSR